MAHREDTLVCTVCHKTFLVESHATGTAYTTSLDIMVTSPCCACPVSARVPQGTTVFAARTFGSAPMLSEHKRDT